MLILGAGRARAAGRRGDPRARRQGRGRPHDRRRSSRGGWNGFNVLHTAAARVGALDLGFVPGRGRPRYGAHARRRQNGEIDFIYLLGADEIDMGRLGAPSSSIRAPMATAAPIAPTSSCRAPPIPKNPALYVNSEGRVQMAEPRRLPARRGARGLGDPARAVGRARQAAAVRLARRSLRAAHVSPRIRISRASIRSQPARCRRRSRTLAKLGGKRRQGAASASRDRRLLSHQPDRARERHHGRMFGAGACAASRQMAAE